MHHGIRLFRENFSSQGVMALELDRVGLRDVQAVGQQSRQYEIFLQRHFGKVMQLPPFDKRGSNLIKNNRCLGRCF